MTTLQKKILVPIPLNDVGKIALNQAVLIANALSMKITVHHVIISSGRVKHKRQLRKTAEEETLAFLNEFFNNNVPDYVDIKVSIGGLVDKILEVSRNYMYDLIIIKKSERKVSRRNWIATNDSDKIICSAHSSVITINDNWTENGIKTILVPIDISQSTFKKLSWASRIALNFDAKIQIASALNIDMNERKSLAFRKARAIRRMLTEKGVKNGFEVIKAEGKEKYQNIIDVSEECNADILIIRTHERVFRRRGDIGKFVAEIIHKSKIPVLTVNTPNESIIASLLKSFKRDK